MNYRTAGDKWTRLDPALFRHIFLSIPLHGHLHRAGGLHIAVVLLKHTEWGSSKAFGLKVAKGQVQGGPHAGTMPAKCCTEPEHVEVL